jgi:hypothetical protein
MRHFQVHLSEVSKFVIISTPSLSRTSNFLHQGDRFLLNVTDSLTDNTMLKSTSIVRCATLA